MDTLFPLDPLYPEGFRYTPSFLSEAEEAELIRFISGMELRPFLFQGYAAKRKTASFGYDWHFENRSLTKGADIPPLFFPLVGKVAHHLALPADRIAELLVTEYPAGSVINWHRDAPPFDLIAGISLQTDCLFRLRPHDQEKQNRSSLVSLTAKRRSLYVLEGPARTDWQHSIAPVKDVRYSITLRTLHEHYRG